MIQFSSVAQLCLTVQPHGLQHTGLPCPSPTPGAYSNSCPLSRWCHPTISSSVIPFSSHLQSFPGSGSFPVSQFFSLGGQSIGVSASASVLPMTIQVWFPLGWTGWISLQSKGLSRVFSSTTEIKVNPRVTSMWGRPVLYLLTFQWKRYPSSPISLTHKWNTTKSHKRLLYYRPRGLVCYHSLWLREHSDAKLRSI